MKLLTLIKYHYGINEAGGPTATTGIIYAKNGDTPDNISRLKIVVTPKEPIQKNETITVKIKANTQEPYKKEISCEITLRIKQVVVNSYTIEDVPNRNYAVLKIVNAQDSGMPITLEFNPNVVRLDVNDEAYVERVSGSEETNSSGYVKKFTFTMNKESAKNIKFYKVDMSKDYTYPSGDTTPVVTVTSSLGS